MRASIVSHKIQGGNDADPEMFEVHHTLISRSVSSLHLPLKALFEKSTSCIPWIACGRRFVDWL
jgi:hypothetical protein